MCHDLWMKPGQYSMKVPASWSIQELDDVTELIPDKGDAAVHVSVFRKTNKTSQPRAEAILLVENFAKKNRLIPVAEFEAECNDHYCSCVGNLSVSSDDQSQPLVWIVKSFVGTDIGVLISLCMDEKQGQSYSEGLAILNSLKLED